MRLSSRRKQPSITTTTTFPPLYGDGVVGGSRAGANWNTKKERN